MCFARSDAFVINTCASILKLNFDGDLGYGSVGLSGKTSILGIDPVEEHLDDRIHIDPPA